MSIVICCFNSERRLSPTLRHAFAQEGCRFPWEVVVVDNACTDDTVGVARRLWERDGVATDFRVVDEPVPGLAAARMRGIGAARYRYILFCDDDNWLSPDYARIAFEVLEGHMDVAAVGGCGTADYEATPPAWISEVETAFGVGAQGSSFGYVDDSRGYLYGAGIVIRRDALEDLERSHLKTLLTGRIGASLTAGDDAELCCLLRLQGWRLWYEERLRFRHRIPASRTTWRYVCGLWRGFGASSVILDIYEGALQSAAQGSRVGCRTWGLQSAAGVARLGALTAVAGLLARNTVSGRRTRLRREWHRGRLNSLLGLRGELHRICETIHGYSAAAWSGERTVPFTDGRKVSPGM